MGMFDIGTELETVHYEVEKVSTIFKVVLNEYLTGNAPDPFKINDGFPEGYDLCI